MCVRRGVHVGSGFGISWGRGVPVGSGFGISSKTSWFTAIKFIMLSMNFLYRLLVLVLCRRRRIFSGYVLAKASEKWIQEDIRRKNRSKSVKKSRFLREKCGFWVVKFVVNEYAVQTYGRTTWPSEAYFCWLRFDKVRLKLAVGKNPSQTSVKQIRKLRKSTGNLIKNSRILPYITVRDSTVCYLL